VKRRTLLASLAAAPLAYLAVGASAVGLKAAELDWGLGRRVLFLTDLHIHGEWRMPALGEYDLVLVGGDTYDEWARDLQAVAEALGQLRGPKIAVLGNHEHWAARRIPLSAGVRALEEAGVHVLRDDWVQVGSLRIFGLDWREDPRSYPAVKDADVVLVHSPDAFHSAVGGLYLAGHTHCGHWCLPWGGAVFTNSAFGYTCGLYKRGTAAMYVSAGLGGTWPRVFCPREVVVVY